MAEGLDRGLTGLIWDNLDHVRSNGLARGVDGVNGVAELILDKLLHADGLGSGAASSRSRISRFESWPPISKKTKISTKYHKRFKSVFPHRIKS